MLWAAYVRAKTNQVIYLLIKYKHYYPHIYINPWICTTYCSSEYRFATHPHCFLPSLVSINLIANVWGKHSIRAPAYEELLPSRNVKETCLHTRSEDDTANSVVPEDYNLYRRISVGVHSRSHKEMSSFYYPHTHTRARTHIWRGMEKLSAVQSMYRPEVQRLQARGSQPAARL
jgi:hypothetical protein